ncbi:hypothetical protein C8R45DRAFT_1006541 [Mycena sanguinolenta]|nr:hypothetical protein C8R45DRAFT_1006541 [Mycena sanguinolenta]
MGETKAKEERTPRSRTSFCSSISPAPRTRPRTRRGEVPSARTSGLRTGGVVVGCVVGCIETASDSVKRLVNIARGLRSYGIRLVGHIEGELATRRPRSLSHGQAAAAVKTRWHEGKTWREDSERCCVWRCQWEIRCCLMSDVGISGSSSAREP